MKKDLLVALAIILLIGAVVLFTDIQSVDEYYLTHIDDITPDSQTVTLSIRCDTVLDNLDKLDETLKTTDRIPADGVILAEGEYVLRPGDTVYDLLDRVARHHRIQLETSGGENSRYVEGIGYLYEFSCGNGSGWNFRVNGEYAGTSCSTYELTDGDKIEWLYTCDFGRDIGTDFDAKEGD